jgi:hypothetical protein
MRARQLLQAGLILLAAVLIPAWIGYGLGRGTASPDQTVLAALAIAGCAGYALGRGSSSQS